jgi:hypothetical protein
MKKIYTFLFSLFVFSILLVNVSLAQETTDKSFGLNATANSVDVYKNQKKIDYSEDFLTGKVGDIIGLVLSFVGVIFLIIIIYSGIMWMTAMGNDQRIEKAKNMIINATIGLIIVFSAYAVTNFIGSQFVN